MKSFKDSKNRTWEFTIDVNAFKRAKAIAGFDLVKLISNKEDGTPDNSALDELANDEVLLASVMFAVCKPAIDTAGVSEDDFYAAFKGDAIRYAFEALLEDYADFFPNPKGEYVKKTVTLTLRLMELGRKQLHEALENLDVDRELEKASAQV